MANVGLAASVFPKAVAAVFPKQHGKLPCTDIQQTLLLDGHLAVAELLC